MFCQSQDLSAVAVFVVVPYIKRKAVSIATKLGSVGIKDGRAWITNDITAYQLIGGVEMNLLNQWPAQGGILEHFQYFFHGGTPEKLKI